MQETTARTEQSNRNSEVLQTHTTPEGTVSLTSKHRVPKHCPEHRAELCKVPVPPQQWDAPSTVLLPLSPTQAPSTQQFPIPGGHKARLLRKLSAVPSGLFVAKEGSEARNPAVES